MSLSKKSKKSARPFSRRLESLIVGGLFLAVEFCAYSLHLMDADLMTKHGLPHIHNPDGEDKNPKDRVGAGKPPLHLIPPAAEILESIAMGLGARKYGEFNWRTSKVRSTVYIAATKRHLAQWLDGQDDDPESGVSHLAHARACLGVLLDAIATGNVIDDRPVAGPAAELIQKHTKAVGLTSPPHLR